MNGRKKALGNKHKDDKRQKDTRVKPDKGPIEINGKSDQDGS